MSYQLPDSKALSFDWSLQPAYSAPPSGDVGFHWAAGFTVESRWSGRDYDVLVTWGSVDEATSYRLTLQYEDGTVDEVTTNVLSHAFRGILPRTPLTVALTPLVDGQEMVTDTVEIETGAGLPGAMDGVDYTFTESSLTPEWPAVEDADGYVVALFRDEVELDRADVADTSVTFEGLEDGTRYTLSFYAYNPQGRGPETTGYDATTAFALPSPPSNIRQDGEMIIGISTLWDAPEKTNQLHIQLFYGDQVLYDEYVPGTQTARTFPVPMASTNYLLRIRAGNPAGWSDWAEAVVYTEKYPLIDSRLGVMATTYQEDALYPDTWDGGTDLAGVGQPQRIDAKTSFEFLTFGFFYPTIMRETGAMSIGVGLMPFTSRPVRQEYTAKEVDAMSIGVELMPFSSRSVQIDITPQERDSMSMAIELKTFRSVRVQFNHESADNIAGMSMSVSVMNITSEQEQS